MRTRNLPRELIENNLPLLVFSLYCLTDPDKELNYKWHQNAFLNFGEVDRSQLIIK